MQPLLKLLKENAALSTRDLASMLDLSEEEVAAQIQALLANNTIVGYQAILNEEAVPDGAVRAVIEVKLTPERGGGFDRLAERICKYNEVSSCYLMSGGYDLLVILQGRGLQEVATFVAEKLATIQGVISTSTHFLLKRYKENGVSMARAESNERLPVSP